jgi:hypothetical protein
VRVEVRDGEDLGLVVGLLERPYEDVALWCALVLCSCLVYLLCCTVM